MQKIIPLRKLSGRDVAERAVKTFLQAALSVVILTNDPLGRATLIAAGAAGVSAAWNQVIAPYWQGWRATHYV